MANLLRITVKRDERTNKVHLKKGMYVEIICNSRTPSTKEKEKICQLFENKYGTLCTHNYVSLSNFDIEKLD